MISLLIISSDKSAREEYACNYAQKLNIHTVDITTFQPETSLGIEDVREIQKKVFLRPMKSKEKAVVIFDAHTATPEAQNALLKLLEEPPVNTHILLTATTSRAFLPTVISRCKIINLDQTAVTHAYTEEQQYLETLQSASVGEKLFYAQELAKDKGQALEKLERLVYAARQCMIEHMGNLSYARMAELLMQTYQQANNTNVNLRFLLEHTFLQLEQSA